MHFAELYFQGHLVGYRAISDSGIYDVEKDKLEALKPPPYRPMEKLTLIERDGLLVSEHELKAHRIVEDVSHSPLRINRLFRGINKSPTSGEAIPVIAIKSSPEIVFKEGVAVILEAESERNGEYDSISESYRVHILFETKRAVEEVCDLLGFVLEKRKTISYFENGLKSFPVVLDDFGLYSLTSRFKIPIGVTRDGFTFTSENRHADYRYSVKLIPPHFDYKKEGVLEDAYTGTTADGITLDDYIQKVRDAFESGYYIFYPTLTLAQIKRY